MTQFSEVAKEYGFDVDLNFRGHGIGAYLHEQPHVSHTYEKIMDDVILEPGMVFTIEPILTLMDSRKILYMGKDNFSYVSLCNPSA